MASALVDRLRARGFVPPDYSGRSLLAIPATVLELLGARTRADPMPLADVDPNLLDGVRQVVVVLADGLGYGQLERLVARGDVPFLARIVERARRGDRAQLLEATTVFPSTTAAAITTLHTARTPQEHGNIAYFLWLEEFGQVTQMLRWGPAANRRGSFFDNQSLDPAAFVLVGSIHARLRERGTCSYVIEPDAFRNEAMTRMHAAAARYVGYLLPTTLGVRLREILDDRPHGAAPAYVYAYWAGTDTAAHWYGPDAPEHDAEAASLDLSLRRALGDHAPGDTLVILTSDHGHAAVDPARLIDLADDEELSSFLHNPVAGEPRLAFLHTAEPGRVRAHLDERWPGAFFFFDRDEGLAAGLFGQGDAAVARRRIGDVCAMLGGDRAAAIVKVDGQLVRHRGVHGGMTPDEMRIPVLLWRA